MHTKTSISSVCASRIAVAMILDRPANFAPNHMLCLVLTSHRPVIGAVCKRWAKKVGPAPEVNPNVPQLLQCDQVYHPDRMCRPDSCCDLLGSENSVCQDQYSKYSHAEIQSICVRSLQFCVWHSSIATQCSDTYCSFLIRCTSVVLLLPF